MMRRLINQTVHVDQCTIYRRTGETVVDGIATTTYDSGTNTPCQFLKPSTATELPGSLNATMTKTTVSSAPSFLLSADVPAIAQADYIIYQGQRYNVTDVSSTSALDGQLELFTQLKK